MPQDLVPTTNALADIPFQKALTVAPVLEDVRKLSLRRLNDAISSSLPEGANVVIQSIDFAFKRNSILVEATANGQAMLDSGKAVLSIDRTGRLLPTIRDAKTGRIIEHLRGTNFPLATKLASLSAVVIGAAHIISGADISKKLDRIGENVSFLVAARKIDQMAKLRSIYEEVRELFSQEDSDRVRWRIKEKTTELAELRYTWLGEVEYHLNQLSYEDSYDSKSWLRKLFTKKKAVDARIENKLTPLAVELQLVDFTLAMELLAYQRCEGNNHYLSQVRLPDEIGSLNRVRDLVKEKSSLLKAESVNVNDLLCSFDDLIRKNECFVSAYSPEQEVDVEQIREIARQYHVGRNDLCPCGSFVKYKKCCGR